MVHLAALTVLFIFFKEEMHEDVIRLHWDQSVNDLS